MIQKKARRSLLSEAKKLRALCGRDSERSEESLQLVLFYLRIACLRTRPNFGNHLPYQFPNFGNHSKESDYQILEIALPHGHCGSVILEDFDPSTVRGNPVYQCRVCENNNDLPFAGWQAVILPMILGRPRYVFVAWAFPTDISMEMPYRPAPEQSHAE